MSQSDPRKMRKEPFSCEFIKICMAFGSIGQLLTLFLNFYLALSIEGWRPTKVLQSFPTEILELSLRYDI